MRFIADAEIGAPASRGVSPIGHRRSATVASGA